MWNTPEAPLALSPLQGAMLVAWRSQFHGICWKGRACLTWCVSSSGVIIRNR